jgi:lysophospholipase L1-like esterase
MREWGFRIVAIAASLLLFECALRTADQPRYDTCWVAGNEFWIEDPVLGFGYQPGTSVAGGVVNDLGLRGPLPAVEKPAGTRRILYVGDSTASGFGVDDDEAFWSLATRAVAERDPTHAVEPLVAAAPGYSSYQNRVLVERFAPYAADWAVLYVGAHNDERRRSYYEDAEIPARAARRRAAWHDVRVLRAGEFLIDRIGRWWSKQSSDPLAYRRVPPVVFEQNLRAMIASLRAAGVKPLLLIPPAAETMLERYPSVPTYQAILKRVAQQEQVPSVALQPLFAHYDPAEVYLPNDDFHPSPLGHRLIAGAVADAIAPAGSAK